MVCMRRDGALTTSAWRRSMPSFAWIESLLRKALPDKFALFNTTNTAKTNGLWQRRALSTKFNQAFPEQ